MERERHDESHNAVRHEVARFQVDTTTYVGPDGTATSELPTWASDPD